MRRVPVRATRWRWVAIIPLLLLAARSTTAGPAATPIEVNWSDIVQIVDQHPRLAAGTDRVDAANGGVAAAGAIPNPTLEATVGQGRERHGVGVGVQWGLSLGVPLGWIAQRGSRIDAAKAQVEIAKAEREALRRDVLLQLRLLFWNQAYEQARAAALELLEAQTKALVQAVRRRVENGEARPIEVTLVEIELEQVTSELDSARISLEARRAELSLWLRTSKGEAIVTVAELDIVPAVIDLGRALEKTRATHPEVLIAGARTRRLAAEVDTERMARVPSFSLEGFAQFDLDQRGYGAGVAVDLPLWNWNTGSIARAGASLAAGEKQAAATSLEIEAAVIDAQAACSAAVATATRFKDNVVPRSEFAASTMERTYQLGEASLLEVLDARRTLLASRRHYLSALAQAQIDCSRLGALIGEEPR
ncbi:MAG TPA: TolC family protein [Polyangia bacterium]|nr:TolC family protein [Polyangia bacterium]